MNQKQQDFQVFKKVKKSKGGTTLFEVYVNMVRKNNANAFMDAKIVLNVQETRENGTNKIPFFLTLPEFLYLEQIVTSGQLSQRITLEKLNALGYLGTNEFQNGTESVGRYKNSKEFLEAYNQVYSDAILMMTENSLQEVCSFASKMGSTGMKLPYFDPIKSWFGGTNANYANRQDKQAEARVFEIVPGNSTDVMFVFKRGQGSTNKNGGIIMKKVEETLRFPFSYEELIQFVTVTKMAIETKLTHDCSVCGGVF